MICTHQGQRTNPVRVTEPEKACYTRLRGLELGSRYQDAIVNSLVSGHFLDSQDARRKARILGFADA
jgi:hypothetical protein